MKKLFYLVVLLSFVVIIPRAWAGLTPPNDDCGDAIAVTVGSLTAGSTTDATTDEPPDLDCNTTVTAPGVWYTVVGTGNTMTASTCNNGIAQDGSAEYDTKITVYCADCADPICVGGNDDFGGCSGFSSRLEWPSQAGATYQILVSGFGSATGDFELAVLDDGIPVDPGTVVSCPALPTDHCPEAQQAAKDAVGPESNYRNHGQYVRTAAKAANPFLKSGEISEECHSCIVNQFARSIPENEQEDCFDFIPEGEACGEDTNGGCNTDPPPPQFGTIACGQTVAGTAWADSLTRDTDWYLLDLPDTGGNGFEMVTATLVSNFEGLSFVVDIAYPMCNPVIVGDYGCSDNGVPIQNASAVLPAPGTYVIFVAPGLCDGSGIYEGIPCDGEENNYTVSVECSDAGP